MRPASHCSSINSINYTIIDISLTPIFAVLHESLTQPCSTRYFIKSILFLTAWVYISQFLNILHPDRAILQKIQLIIM